MRTHPLCLPFLMLFAVPMAFGPVQAYQCGPGPICAPPMVTVCGPPVVPLAPCCRPSPLFPPAPPIQAPVIVFPEPTACQDYAPPPPLPAPSPAPTAQPPYYLPPPPQVRKTGIPQSGVMSSSSQLYGGPGMNGNLGGPYQGRARTRP